MEDIEKEKIINNYPKPVTIKGTMKILDQLQNYICKIENKIGNVLDFFVIFLIKIKK